MYMYVQIFDVYIYIYYIQQVQSKTLYKPHRLDPKQSAYAFCHIEAHTKLDWTLPILWVAEPSMLTVLDIHCLLPKPPSANVGGGTPQTKPTSISKQPPFNSDIILPISNLNAIPEPYSLIPELCGQGRQALEERGEVDERLPPGVLEVSPAGSLIDFVYLLRALKLRLGIK